LQREEEDDETVPTVAAARLGVDGVVDTVKVSVRWTWLRCFSFPL
jgi:hypothetical protein